MGKTPRAYGGERTKECRKWKGRQSERGQGNSGSIGARERLALPSEGELLIGEERRYREC